ncbi:Lysophosphatidylcholine acyltransferase 1, partial [Ophiophagus hannah]
MRLKGRGCCTRSSGNGDGEEEGSGEGRGPPPPPMRSPFVHRLHFSAFQKAKIVFMTLTLFPIRLFFAAFMMLLAWPFAFIASIGSAEKQLEKPLSWWRKIVDILLKAIMRTMWLAGGFHWINVKGRQALPTEAAILTLAPHSSYFDAIPVTMTMASIVMKAESKDIPVWGTLIKYIRPVFVSRSDQDSRRKTVEEIRRRAQSNGKWPQIMIFPEGTCTNRSCLITFKPGAFIPGVPVQPVILRYPNKLFLPVYIPSEEEKKNPSLYANNVRRVMAEALGISVTDYTFEDCQLALAEGQLYLPSNTCLLEFAKLVRNLGLKPEKLEKELDAYSERARKLKNKKITLKEFAEYLKIQVSDMLENMFALFEEMYQSETGGVTEQELTSILKSAMGVSDLNVSSLFKAIDDKEKGEIAYDDFHYFTETFPNFAEEYLYPDQMESKSYLETPAPNGFCADFSPQITENRRNSLQKKMN